MRGRYREEGRLTGVGRSGTVDNRSKAEIHDRGLSGGPLE